MRAARTLLAGLVIVAAAEVIAEKEQALAAKLSDQEGGDQERRLLQGSSDGERFGLFIDDGSPVQEVDAAWFADPKRANFLREEDGVIVINFYSASCGHCQTFAPTWRKVAQHAQQAKCKTHLLAINCDEFRDTCSLYNVRSVPYLLGFAKGSVIRRPETAHEIEESMHEILRWMSEADKDFDRAVLHHSDSSESSEDPENDADPELSEESAAAAAAAEAVDHLGNRLSAKEMLRRDIAAAVRFGLETGVFLGRFELGGEELAALYAWLNVLRESFPGVRERAQMEKLFRSLKEREDKTRHVLSVSAFDAALESWDFAVYTPDQRTKWRAIWYTCRPATLQHVGVHGGYPCALWKLFHVLTVASGAGGASADRTLTGIVGFIRYSFSCNDCRKHFLESNPNPQREILQSARQLGISPARALTLFIWSEHNAVSKRLNAEDAALGDYGKSNNEFSLTRRAQFDRPTFPEVYHCRSCRLAASQPKLRRDAGDAAYLSSAERSVGPNAGFRDQILYGRSSSSSSMGSIENHASGDAPGARDASREEPVAWDYDAVYIFLQHTYCFPDDPKLHCQVQEGQGQLSTSAIVFLVVTLACGVFAYMRQRPGKSPLIKKV